MAESLVFVGTYSEPILFGTGQVLQGRGQGIHAFRFDAATGALAALAVTRGVRNPSYIAFDPARRFLYCVNEFKQYEGKPGGAVSAFRIDRASGALTHLNSQASHGTDPCHLVVDATGRHVLVANFAGGSVCVLPIQTDGALGDASQVIAHQGTGIDPVRQTGPHPHAVTIDRGNRRVFVPDLGIDKVMIYAFDAANGTLSPNPAQRFIATAPGAGPRQLAMHPAGDLAYLINELDSTVSAYRHDQARGTLAELQTISTLPAGFAGESTCAELQIAPSGKFLYGSNRGHDSIAVFAIDRSSGLMRLLGHESTRGRMPRNFTVSPDGAHVVAANQDTDDLYTYRVDAATGMLVWTGQRADVGTPVCVQFL